MRNTFLVLAVAVVLALPVLASKNTQANDERQNSAGTGHHGGFDGLNETQMQKGLDRAEKHGLFSKLACTGGACSGKFVAFGFNASTGALSNYQDLSDKGNATLFFNSVTPTPASAGSVDVKGSLLRFNGTAWDLKVHNNPTAAFAYRASAASSVQFNLAPGVSIVPSNDTKEVKVLAGVIHGHILTSGNASIVVAGSSITVSLSAGESAAFRAHPAKGADNLHDENAALKSHKLGATLRIADAGGVAAEDGTEFDVHASTRSIGKNHVELDIDSAQHEGRVLFLTIDGETLSPGNVTAFVASLNGTVIPRVATAAEASANNGPLGAVAFVRSTDGLSTVVVVRVPHFSSYALALAQLPASGSSGTTSGTAAGATSGSTAGSTTSQGAPALGILALGAIGVAALARRRSA